MERKLEAIAWDLCELYYVTKPPIDEDGNVIYFMAGSLATLPYLCADSIEELIVEKGKVIGYGDKYYISEEAKSQFIRFRRQIKDTDYVYVTGRPSKSFMSIIKSKIPDIDIISDSGKRVVNLSDQRECEMDINIVLLHLNNRSIIVPNPIDIIGYKILQTITNVQMTNDIIKKDLDEDSKQRIIFKQQNDYQKCLKDLEPIINAVCLIYTPEKISMRLKEMLVTQEKLDYDILNQIQSDIITINKIDNNDNINRVFELTEKSKLCR